MIAGWSLSGVEECCGGRKMFIWHSGEMGNGVRALCVDSLVLGSVEACMVSGRGWKWCCDWWLELVRC